VTTPLPVLVRRALLPVGILWALGAEWTRLEGGWPLTWVLADLIPGIVFLVAGLVAWERRPDTRVGSLMVAISFAWYVGTYGASMDPRLGVVAHAFQGYFLALLAWLVLAYPSGRLRDLASRLVVAAWLVLLVVRSGFRLAVNRPSTDYDLTKAAEIDRYVRDISLRDSGDAVFAALMAVLAGVVLVLIVHRLITETGAGRRVAGPILAGGIALAIGVVVQVAAVATAGSFAERSFAWDLSQALNIAALTIVAIAFAVGVARGRLARGSVADLVVELGDSPDRPLLRDVLARALRDPSLEIAYAVPATSRFVDAAGRDVVLPALTDPDRAMTRLEGGGRTVAVLIHDPALSDQPELVRSVAAATRLAIENERLAAEVRTQLDEVRASRARIVVAGDAERRRVERDLHDGAQQRLVTLALALQMARGQVDPADEVAGSLDRAGRELELALAELRELARGLHPTVLTEEGLAVAVEALADRTPLPVTVRAPAERYRPEVEATAYFVVAEALTNVVKYAKASTVTLSIERRDGFLAVEVADDGVGGADVSRGSGLRGLDDRVAAVGGTFEVRSEAGEGTVIRADIPCE
jgi:signal transduction histidine kinase